MYKEVKGYILKVWLWIFFRVGEKEMGFGVVIKKDVSYIFYFFFWEKRENIRSKYGKMFIYVIFLLYYF